MTARKTNRSAATDRATYPVIVPVLPNWKIPMQFSQIRLPLTLVLPKPPRRAPATSMATNSAARTKPGLILRSFFIR